MNHIQAILKLLAVTLPTLPLCAMLIMGCCGSGLADSEPTMEASPIVWYEERQEKTAWPAPDELAVFTKAGVDPDNCHERLQTLLGTQATVIEKTPTYRIIRWPATGTPHPLDLERRLNALGTQSCVAGYGLVYYIDKQRDPTTRLIHSNEIIVRFHQNISESQIAELESRFDLKLNRELRYAPNTMIYSLSRPGQVIETANRLQALDEVVYAYPNWLRRRVTK